MNVYQRYDLRLGRINTTVIGLRSLCPGLTLILGTDMAKIAPYTFHLYGT